MTRGQFVENYLKTVDAFIYREPCPTVRVITQLIESVYDLQQQLNDLQEKQDDSYKNDN